MAKKNAKPTPSTSATPSTSSPTPTTASEPAVVLSAREPVVKINPNNLVELKNAVDDVLKEFFSHPSHRFTRSFVHEDVRLALGWSAVAVAAATGWYGYTTEFHESKQWVGVGVVVYVILNTALTLYVAYFEKNTIFVGKRRTFASRITTERLTLSSHASSSPSHTTCSSWVPFPLTLLVPSPSSSPLTSSTSSTSTSPPSYPLYSLHLSYTHSSNANKSLLHANEVYRTEAFKEWFDREGRIARRRVEEWAEGALREGVGMEVEGGQGRKEE
ncbi:hypothetical protein JCM8547_008668 [Rhodosporidiobolus lusitaniae]